MSELQNEVRIIALQSFQHVKEDGAKLAFVAKHFYHVAKADAEALVAKGLAKTEEELKKAEDALDRAATNDVAAAGEGSSEDVSAG